VSALATATEVRPDTRFFGHPSALANLSGVAMWERFTYYGMLGILPLYLYYSVADGGLAMSAATATSIVGAYGGLVYLSTIAGAWVADRVLGAERTLFYSGLLMTAGQFSLVVLPGYTGIGVGLVCVALGSGGFKCNATSVVGSLYSEADERRDGGFSLFYMGMNLGTFVGPLVVGLTQSGVGFRLGFGLAGVGMALGLVRYALGRRELPGSASAVPNPLPASNRRTVGAAVAGAVVLVVLAPLTGLVTATNLSDVVVWIAGLATVSYFAVILTSRKITSVERRRVLAFIPMFVASVVFWALYLQQYTVVAVYADKRLDRDLFGWEMPVSWVYSLAPVFVILLAPVFALVWTRLGPRQPSTPIKFALGTAIMGVAFLLFLRMPGSDPNSAPLLGLTGILLVFTIAELLLSPVGLSLSTKLAPQAFRTQMVAVFFLSISLGSALSGSLAQYYSTEHEATYFGVIGGVAVVVGALMALASPFVRKLMVGIR
jgi:POT family proton-dependent oligopeptide transporter